MLREIVYPQYFSGNRYRDLFAKAPIQCIFAVHDEEITTCRRGIDLGLGRVGTNRIDPGGRNSDFSIMPDPVPGSGPAVASLSRATGWTGIRRRTHNSTMGYRAEDINQCHEKQFIAAVGLRLDSEPADEFAAARGDVEKITRIRFDAPIDE